MRIYITGLSGLLGANFAFQQREFHEVSGSYLGHPFSYPGVVASKLDVTSAQDVMAAFGKARPDLVIHTAGLTNVDECELNEPLANNINAAGSFNVAAAAREAGARLVHVSTDHLWSDERPFVREEEPPRPLNAYARSKLLAEQRVGETCPDALILRTNFFGWGTTLKSSLAEWVLAKLRRREPLRMFHDVFITPILINDLVDLTMELAAAGATGVYNACGRDRVSKYEFGRIVASAFGHDSADITAVPVGEGSLVAPRPNDMSLSCEKVERFAGRRMPSAAEGVSRMAELEKERWPQLLAAAVAANVER